MPRKQMPRKQVKLTSRAQFGSNYWRSFLPGVGDIELSLRHEDRPGAIALNGNAMFLKLAGGQVAPETGDDFTTEKSSGTEITGS